MKRINEKIPFCVLSFSLAERALIIASIGKEILTLLHTICLRVPPPPIQFLYIYNLYAAQKRAVYSRVYRA